MYSTIAPNLPSGKSCLRIPRDSLRQKFLPQIRKGAFLDLRHFFLICGVFFRIAAELVFSFFYPPICGGNRRECGGNRRECGGNSRKANGVAAFLFWLRRFFLFAADFLECGGNFRRNALRQKFPPQEVLGMHVGNARRKQHAKLNQGKPHTGESLKSENSPTKAEFMQGVK